MTLRAVVFDVGETLVNETRVWSAWADWPGIPRLTFLAVFDAVIARGGDHREPLRIFRPGLDLGEELRKREASGLGDRITADDLYPDARFFEQIGAELDVPAAEIADVGDRVDNDIRPAASAGMQAIFIRHGPWRGSRRRVTTRPRRC